MERKLDVNNSKNMGFDIEEIDRKRFLFLLNEDEMASYKLSEGIRRFCSDTVKLEKIVELFLSNISEKLCKK